MKSEIFNLKVCFNEDDNETKSEAAVNETQVPLTFLCLKINMRFPESTEDNK